MPKSTQVTHDCYVFIRENRSGEEWIIPLEDDDVLDLALHVDKWIERHFDGVCTRDGDFMRKMDGQFTATIYTDNRQPDSVACWTSGGFYVKDELV